MTPTPTFAVPITGVGRADYSEGIEFSVEPTIRSYQQVYNSWQVITVPAGADVVTDIAIPGGHVALVYDFFATVPDLLLLLLDVKGVNVGLVASVLNKERYGSISVHLAKGFPFFQIIRFTVHNFHTVARDVNIGAVGVLTDEAHYYLEIG